MASPRIGARRLDAAFLHAREPVFLLDAERRLSFVNRAWEELTGIPAERALGLACNPHGPTDSDDLAGLGGSFCPPPEALDGRPCGGPTLIVHADGSRLWRRLEFWPYHDARGSLTCLLGQVRSAEDPPHAPDADSQRLRAELMEVRAVLHDRHGFDALVGKGPAHRRLLEQVALAASSANLSVMLVGEPGTGKRTVARTIHGRSAGAHRPLIPLDADALTPLDLARALFAEPDETVSATLRLPEGSTLLLTDVERLPRDIQARISAALETGADLRLIGTTAIDPDRSRRDDRLLPRLFFALTGLVLHLSPLRDRPDDFPLLAQHLLERANRRGPRQRGGFAPEAIDALIAYDWPGNLRELARVIEHAHARGSGDPIGVDDLPADIRGHLASAYMPPPILPTTTPLDDLLTQLERRLIEGALRLSRHNKSRAAELLEISRPRLYRRIKELNIPDEPEPVIEDVGRA